VSIATIFSIEGPREITAYKGAAGRSITGENIRDFWKKNSDLANQRGCYVFGIRAGTGLTPAYVGRASRSFKQEVFAAHKLARYHQFLVDYQRGTPVLFFVVAPKRAGVSGTTDTRIKELEKFLIQNGVAANPGLLNIKGTKAEEWGIAGVLRGGKGRPSASACRFRQLMKFGK
jgi:hypothetical protein